MYCIKERVFSHSQKNTLCQFYLLKTGRDHKLKLVTYSKVVTSTSLVVRKVLLVFIVNF